VNREFQRLAESPFDLLVIGGGIYGAWAAYDAALRGMRVALVERHDWAAGTSSASTKLIHGGLRYLEHREFKLVRKTLAERGLLMKLGPHRVRPLRILLPIYTDTRVGRRRLRLGLWLYDWLAGRRRVIEKHRKLSRRRTRFSYRFLNASGLVCGFTFSDCQTDDARFVLELVDGVVQAGAVAVNRARATRLLVQHDSVVGAHIEDVETGKSIEVLAKLTLNCAGPWGQKLVETHRPVARPLARLSKGAHLVLPELPTSDGVLLFTRSHGGVVFMLPWQGRTLLGTTDTEFQGDPDRLRVESSELTYLLAQANHVLGASTWQERDVISAFAGLRVLPVTEDGSTAAVSRELAIEEPLPNLLTPIGGKYTSARADAESLIDIATDRLGERHRRGVTSVRPLPWAPAGRYRRWLRRSVTRGLELGLDEATVEACQMRYGNRIARIFDLVSEQPALAGRLHPDVPFCLAEVVHAVKYEMARSLEDVVRRRVPLLLLARPTQVELLQAADLMGPFLDWSDRRKHDEVAAVFRKPGANVVDADRDRG
jgi:glycerol-3-phosphate dehydrogenase